MLVTFFSFTLCCTSSIIYLAEHLLVQILVLKEKRMVRLVINKNIFFAMWLLDRDKYEFCSLL